MLKTPKKPVQIGESYMRFPKESSTQKRKYSKYICSCGSEFEAIPYDVDRGHTNSCGCHQVKVARSMFTTHGFRNHRLYNSWNGMIRRTTDQNHSGYINYGGRGIVVCDRWKDISSFIEDMNSTYVDGLSIDRIDNDGNYEPQNCRWSTDEVQRRNTRLLQKNNTSGYRGVSYNKDRGKYYAFIGVDKKRICLGSFLNPVDAAIAYDKYVVDNNLEHTINNIRITDG